MCNHRGGKTLVTYRNQPKICTHCGEAAHPKQKCAEGPKAANENKNPAQATPCEVISQPLDEEEFPPLTVSSAVEITNLEHDTKQHNETNSRYNTTTDIDDNGNNNDDDDDNGDGDDDTGSTENDFTDIAMQKRRLSQRLLSKRENDKKKPCLSQGNQNSNRYHVLGETDPLVEPGKYLNRSSIKSKKCTPSL